MSHHGLLARQTAYRLVADDQLTLGEAARAAGAHRASVAWWCRDLPSTARHDYFVSAWSRFTAACPGMGDDDLARMVIARGAGTPSDVAHATGCDVRLVHRWIKGIDYRAARSAFVRTLWSAALDRRSAERAAQGMSTDHAFVRHGRTIRRVDV